MSERRWRNPFRGFFDYISETNRQRENWMINSPTAGTEAPGQTLASAWVPATDIFANGDDLIIQCELAGVSREDIELHLSGGLLTIEGERRLEEQGDEDEGTPYYVRERFRGTFRRAMSLPEGISEDKINAHFENGLLEVTVGGGAVEGPRRISIAGSES